jgi:APA family basic amino acid/polyamine antiporter
MPFNARIRYKGRPVDFPILGVIGMIGVSTIFFEVILTHDIGRIAGPVWILLCFLYYAWYRYRERLPVFRSLRRNWEEEQRQVLLSAEEYDLLEQYKIALAERDRQKRRNAHRQPAS